MRCYLRRTNIRERLLIFVFNNFMTLKADFESQQKVCFFLQNKLEKSIAYIKYSLYICNVISNEAETQNFFKTMNAFIIKNDTNSDNVIESPSYFIAISDEDFERLSGDEYTITGEEANILFGVSSSVLSREKVIFKKSSLKEVKALQEKISNKVKKYSTPNKGVPDINSIIEKYNIAL